MVGWLVYLGKREFPVDPRTENRGGNSGTERIYGYGNPAANPLNTTESPRKASLSNLRRNRHNVYQAVTRTEMLKILGFRFLALADDIMIGLRLRRLPLLGSYSFLIPAISRHLR